MSNTRGHQLLAQAIPFVATKDIQQTLMRITRSIPERCLLPVVGQITARAHSPGWRSRLIASPDGDGA
jgi:hypothetical protein